MKALTVTYVFLVTVTDDFDVNGASAEMVVPPITIIKGEQKVVDNDAEVTSVEVEEA